jgi:hypothetical protein
LDASIGSAIAADADAARPRQYRFIAVHENRAAVLLRLACAMSERWRDAEGTRLRLAALETNVAELHERDRRHRSSESREELDR